MRKSIKLKKETGIRCGITLLLPGINVAPSFNGSLSEIWFSNTSMNMDTLASRQLFITNYLEPVLLGATGANPGVGPQLYLSGNAMYSNINSGTGTNLIIMGTPAIAQTAPSDI